MLRRCCSLISQARRQVLIRAASTPTQLIRTFHKEYNAAQEDQSFKLDDGRIIGFAEYGDLQGTPAFFLHGSPGSRYDGYGLVDLARRLKLRVICPDRPGYGLSSFQQRRSLGDYSKDILQLAKRLGCQKYHVFGQSGGGPYAVACAYALPQDQLLNVGVIAGMGPPEILNLKTAGWYTMAVMGVMRWTPNFFQFLMNRSLRKLHDDKKLDRQLQRYIKFLPKEVRAKLSKPESVEFIKATLRAAYHQGTAGAIRDCEIYFTPWDFRLQDVRKKVLLFYGDSDNRTPSAFGRYYKTHLPMAELIEYKNTNHWNINDHDEETLGKLFNVDRIDKLAVQ